MAHMVLLNTNLLMANDITQGNDAFQTNITVPAIEKTMSRKKYVVYPFFVPVIKPLYMTKKSCNSKHLLNCKNHYKNCKNLQESLEL